jgi:hypothetical protein
MVKSGSHPGQRFPQAEGWHKWNTEVPAVETRPAATFLHKNLLDNKFGPDNIKPYG